jgi:hypothetical protein
MQQQARKKEYLSLWIFQQRQIGKFSWFIRVLQLQFLQLLQLPLIFMRQPDIFSLRNAILGIFSTLISPDSPMLCHKF